MKTLKFMGISFIQGFLFTVLSYVIIRTFIPFSEMIPDDTTGAIGIMGGTDGPTAIFFTSKVFSGNIFILNFIVSYIIICIANTSAMIPHKMASLWTLILCNLLMIFYCYLFLNYGTAILLSTILIGVIILTMGYIVIRSASDF